MLFRGSSTLLAKQQKQSGFHIIRDLVKKQSQLHVKEDNITVNKEGEEIQSVGSRLRHTKRTFHDQVAKIEEAYVWVWYPWRAHPEHPVPALPCPRALKNLQGALVNSLTPIQKRNMERMLYGMSIPKERDETFAQSHPFLSYIVKRHKGKAKSFPFWYKKYPTTNHAYENRFAVPSEMLEDVSPEVRRVFSFTCMTQGERVRAEIGVFCERYCPHDLKRTSIPARCVRYAIAIREARNKLLTHPHNQVLKFRMGIYERKLEKAMRTWRKQDFRAYWEFVRDHDMLDIVQPSNKVKYRWGQWWRTDWNLGVALTQNAMDYIDPRGLTGCVETGRSRAEVARDLGLSYTRTLNANERKYFEEKATYFERLQGFKIEHTESRREQERQQYLQQVQAMYQQRNGRNLTVDIPRTKNQAKNISLQRWKSWRHGPQ